MIVFYCTNQEYNRILFFFFGSFFCWISATVKQSNTISLSNSIRFIQCQCLTFTWGGWGNLTVCLDIILARNGIMISSSECSGRITSAYRTQIPSPVLEYALFSFLPALTHPHQLLYSWLVESSVLGAGETCKCVGLCFRSCALKLWPADFITTHKTKDNID